MWTSSVLSGLAPLPTRARLGIEGRPSQRGADEDAMLGMWVTVLHGSGSRAHWPLPRPGSSGADVIRASDSDELADGHAPDKTRVGCADGGGPASCSCRTRLLGEYLRSLGPASLDLGGEIRRQASVGIDVSDRGRGRTAPRAIINSMA